MVQEIELSLWAQAVQAAWPSQLTLAYLMSWPAASGFSKFTCLVTSTLGLLMNSSSSSGSSAVPISCCTCTSACQLDHALSVASCIVKKLGSHRQQRLQDAPSAPSLCTGCSPLQY